MTAISDLGEMDRATLGQLWSQVIGDAVPPHMSQIIQRRLLAYAIQVRAQGDVSASVANRFERVACGDMRPATPTLRPGGRLLRQWNGTTHVVDVVEGGFLWNGRQHRSLSAIARAITGTRWSGPRFFGLTDEVAKASAAEKTPPAKPQRPQLLPPANNAGSSKANVTRKLAPKTGRRAA